MKKLIIALLLLSSLPAFSGQNIETILEITDFTDRLNVESITVKGVATQGNTLNGCKIWDFHHGKRFKQISKTIAVKDNRIAIEDLFGKCKVKISEIKISLDVYNTDGFKYPLGSTKPELFLTTAGNDSNLNFACGNSDFRERSYVRCHRDLAGNLNRQTISLDGNTKEVRIFENTNP